MVVCFREKGALMNTRWAVGLCAIALVTIPVFPNSSAAQGKSLKDQLVGTWIYVSATAKGEDGSGSTVPRPSAQGAVTYTATYTLDESTKTAHLNIETSSVPNFVGDPNQRRIVTSITDEELKITNLLRPGVTLELVFKRAK